MTSRLRNHSVITVSGPSGAGKSSFIRAGVIPALERSGQLWESYIAGPAANRSSPWPMCSRKSRKR